MKIFVDLKLLTSQNYLIEELCIKITDDMWYVVLLTSLYQSYLN